MTANSGPPSDDSAPQDPTLLLSAPAQPRGPSELMPNLDEFDFIGELGRGGMGIVYKAIRKNDRQTVAVKVIRKDRLLHDDSVKRFRREAQAAARLNHPNIVRVFDSDHTGDTHYLVMEYVAGVTLERLVEQHGPVDFKIAVSFLRQSALALAHAQEQGLVHRDIKPSNIMVVSSGAGVPGSDSLVKVLDMGVARILTSEHHPGEALSTLTQGGSVIGTADFVAPEQLEDPHGADVRADLYSLGCTFYFVTVGEVPFPGGSLISKLDKQRWEVPRPIHTIRPQIAPAVADVVAKLLAKKPTERYQSPHELLAALDLLVSTGYESSEPAGPEPREVKTLTGHSGSVSCVATTVSGLIASSGKDQTIRLWNIASSDAIRVIARQPQELRAVAFSSIGDRLAAAVGVSVRLFDPNTGQETKRLSGHTAAVRAVAFSHDDRWLFTGGDDKTLRVWDLQLGREVQRFTRHSAAVTCLAAPADSDFVYSGSRDQSLRRWELRSGQESQVWSASGGPVLAIALSPDGSRAATAHFDTSIRLWKLDEPIAVGELTGHKQMVTGVGFLPDGRSLVSASQDQTVRWWNLDAGSEIACHDVGTGILALALAPGSRAPICAGADGTLRVIEIP